ncbi:hypothetical protein PpBr36_08875 [Pyricularia pennisetigena]|uniref:hypothetical protein n=1 Tax=Pyricularia pennisetigena TaxID=1578925 RepID=UPI00115278DE|nr:hypothetical protein PpBr36_08875 [Pyricularia pennisetigena]TLS24941.1 hypothetical protein PpBr36_08875 [Pyricularia pennisetigena]
MPLEARLHDVVGCARRRDQRGRRGYATAERTRTVVPRRERDVNTRGGDPSGGERPRFLGEGARASIGAGDDIRSPLGSLGESCNQVVGGCAGRGALLYAVQLVGGVRSHTADVVHVVGAFGAHDAEHVGAVEAAVVPGVRELSGDVDRVRDLGLAEPVDGRVEARVDHGYFDTSARDACVVEAVDLAHLVRGKAVDRRSVGNTQALLKLVPFAALPAPCTLAWQRHLVLDERDRPCFVDASCLLDDREHFELVEAVVAFQVERSSGEVWRVERPPMTRLAACPELGYLISNLTKEVALSSLRVLQSRAGERGPLRCSTAQHTFDGAYGSSHEYAKSATFLVQRFPPKRPDAADGARMTQPSVLRGFDIRKPAGIPTIFSEQTWSWDILALVP